MREGALIATLSVLPYQGAGAINNRRRLYEIR